MIKFQASTTTRIRFFELPKNEISERFKYVHFSLYKACCKCGIKIEDYESYEDHKKEECDKSVDIV